MSMVTAVTDVYDEGSPSAWEAERYEDGHGGRAQSSAAVQNGRGTRRRVCHGEDAAARDGVPPVRAPSRSSRIVAAAPGSRAAMVMTQQYLAGELSVLLAEMQATVSDPAAACAAARLRGEVETRPVAALAAVALRALDLIDAACWESVARGDTAAFDRQAVVAGELYDFGVCAGLLAER
ncbi:hypothetical protein [Amycolatopsis sp. NPDC051903]|uniref:hypothetical protein n=1 Tax=Amycolatopsis sp. NPDC051903 TaxID=3363936 RepID=UPI00379AF76A